MYTDIAGFIFVFIIGIAAVTFPAPSCNLFYGIHKSLEKRNGICLDFVYDWRHASRRVNAHYDIHIIPAHSLSAHSLVLHCVI